MLATLCLSFLLLFHLEGCRRREADMERTTDRWLIAIKGWIEDIYFQFNSQSNNNLDTTRLYCV